MPGSGSGSEPRFGDVGWVFAVDGPEPGPGWSYSQKLRPPKLGDRWSLTGNDGTKLPDREAVCRSVEGTPDRWHATFEVVRLPVVLRVR